MSSECKTETSPNLKYIRLSQFYAALNRRNISSEKILHGILGGILHSGGDIDYGVPENGFVKQHTPNTLGDTPLHLSVSSRNLGGLLFFLKRGANVTIKNHNGFTTLRSTVRLNNNKCQKCLDKRDLINHTMANHLLNFQIDKNDSTNPKCRNGISHLHIACMLNHTNAVEFFFRAGLSINDAVEFDSHHLPGYTPLHFAVQYCCLDTFKLLLELGANVGLKDSKGMTAMHLLIERSMKIMDLMNLADPDSGRCCYETQWTVNEEMIKHLLVRSKSLVNVDSLLFHLACVMGDESMTDYLSKCDADINNCIEINLPTCQGYTPLHMAAHFSIETVKILLSKGANLLTEDAKGVTPFDICIDRYDTHDIYSILSSQTFLKDITFSDNKKLIDLIHAIHDYSLFLKKLNDKNIFIGLDSMLWPGYTPLHLAVVFAKNFVGDWDFYQVEWLQVSKDPSRKYDKIYEKIRYRMKESHSIVSSLLHNGANFTVQEANGLTPLHLAFLMQKKRVLDIILNHQPRTFVNSIDPRNFSHFHIACATLNREYIEGLLGIGVDVNSPVESDITYDPRNSIPKNPVIRAGSTPLHISIAFQARFKTDPEVPIKTLLNSGADPRLKDADGVTPLHLAFAMSKMSDCSEVFREIVSLLLDKKFLTENPTSDEGLSHFHIACAYEDTDAIEALIKLGVNVNERMNCEVTDTYANKPRAIKGIEYWVGKHDPMDQLILLAPYAGFTPLHFAVSNGALRAVEILMKHGADVHAKSANGSSPLHMVLTDNRLRIEDFVRCFSTVLDPQDVGRIDDTGLTWLHIACLVLDSVAVERLLSSGANANAQINFSAPIWSGDTPLHVLFTAPSYLDKFETIKKIIASLLRYGADVTIKNSDDVSPLHKAFGIPGVSEKNHIIELMLHGHGACNNPVNNEGLSHFHIICTTSNLSLAEKFLELGVDINLPKDHFVCTHGGFSPLHFATIYRCQKMIDLLLRYKANVDSEDNRGNTPLHLLARNFHPYEGIIQKYSSLNTMNIFGETPLALYLDPNRNYNCKLKVVELLLKHGARVNVINPNTLKGLLALAFTHDTTNVLTTLVNSASDIHLIDAETGFNAIHNLVSDRRGLKTPKQYANAIDSILKKGCELDHQDNKGRTALHVAAEFENLNAVIGLLMIGADINIMNKYGKTAFSSGILNFEKSHISLIFFMHIQKLIFFKFRVNPENEISYENASKSFNLASDRTKQFLKESEEVKQFKIKKSYSLYDFLQDESASEFPMMSKHERETLVNLIENSTMLLNTFPEISGLLKLQLRIAETRKKLIEPAKPSLRILSQVGLPDPCSEGVIKNLNNEDLENLIKLRDYGNIETKKRKLDE